jgi:uncharacterized protein YbcI
MSFFGQSHIPGLGDKEYNKQDVWQNISDISDIISLCRDETRKELMSLAVQSEWYMKLRDLMYDALNESIHKKEDMRKFEWLDKVNPLYRKLSYLYEVIAINPELRTQFIKTLTENIKVKLANVKGAQISIAKIIGDVTPQNFQKYLTDIRTNAWHAGVIYFLEECIREWKVVKDVDTIIKLKQKPDLSGATLEDLDYVNLASLSAFHKKVNTKESKDGVSFSLSGGISNAFSQLGIIKKTLALWQEIRSISGTSMGGILAVLV